jgi:hypothetical protein
MLCAGDFASLTQKFGYALAYDRDPSAALAQDVSSCLDEVGAIAVAGPSKAPNRVSYFKGNDTGLFALVECDVLADTGAELLLELIVSSKGGDRYVTLEQIST